MKALLIMNPGARSGRGRRLWKTWEGGLCERGVQFDIVPTERPGHAFRVAREARGFDAVVAVGGDGTINEVLDGVIQSGDPDRKMGVLYSGTSPDFCRFHGIPLDPGEALAALLSGGSKQVDAARIEYGAKNNDPCTSHFACGCNIGLGASVARFSNRARRFLGDGLGTAVGVIHSLFVSRPLDLELEIDGESFSLPRTNNLSILKNPHIASGLKLNLDLRPDDGRMCVFGLHGKGRFGILKALPGFYSGSAAADPRMFLKFCKSITVRSGNRDEIEFDGDPRGYLPLEIDLVPGAFHLIGSTHERVRNHKEDGEKVPQKS